MAQKLRGTETERPRVEGRREEEETEKENISGKRKSSNYTLYYV